MKSKTSAINPTQLAIPQGDRVILVHGTYASRKSDQGEQWWQVGSQPWSEIQKRLPAGVCMSQAGEVFHWSGENSERARIKAAFDLLQHMKTFEAAGIGYHLIGHSHGGSVIWHALRLATQRRCPLEHLGSWSTVGTPFLHHRTRGAWNASNLISLLLALVLIKPAYAVLVTLAILIGGPIIGYHPEREVALDDLPSQLSFYHTPVLKTLDTLGVPVVVDSDGVRIGAYDSAAGDSILAFLWLTPTGWLMLCIALLTAYVYLNLGAFFLGPVLESRRIRIEKRLERVAYETYQGRWLGIWSTEDEAINGLRATLDLSVSFVSRMSPRDRILFSDQLSLLGQPYRWLLTPVFNALIRPFLDGAVRQFVVKTAQGNNRPAAEVTEVSPAPVRLSNNIPLPPIPDWLNERILYAANHHASDLAPKLRSLLAAPSFASGLESFGTALSGRELVHTSYFDHSEILDLLCMHIALTRDGAGGETYTGPDQQRLRQWLIEMKQQVGAALPTRRLWMTSVQEPHALVRPRRRDRANQRRAA